MHARVVAAILLLSSVGGSRYQTTASLNGRRGRTWAALVNCGAVLTLAQFGNDYLHCTYFCEVNHVQAVWLVSPHPFSIRERA